MAIDSRGRMYVSTGAGVQIFADKGRYLGVEEDGGAMGTTPTGRIPGLTRNALLSELRIRAPLRVQLRLLDHRDVLGSSKALRRVVPRHTGSVEAEPAGLSWSNLCITRCRGLTRFQTFLQPTVKLGPRLTDPIPKVFQILEMFGALARCTQLSALTHSPCVLQCSVELHERGISVSTHFSLHFALVILNFPDELLEPSVADSEIPCPSTTRRLTAVAAGIPLPHKPSDHA